MVMEVYKKILSYKIKSLREVKGIKQETIAQELGVSQGTYNNWETGRRTPELETIIKIADYYEVELDYLFGRDIKTTRRIKEQ